MESDRIDAGIDAAAGQERRQGRREAQAARAFGEVERLDAKPVARQHHAAAVPLQDREGEHAVEPLDAALAPGVVGLEDPLRIAAGEEAVAGGLELRPDRTGTRLNS